MRILPAVFRFGIVTAVCAPNASAQGRGQPGADPDSRQKLAVYLDAIAENQLAARKQALAQIGNRADAERRKVVVREKLLGLIGGLPERKGPVAVRTFGTTAADGFRIEKIESLPGFWVTANLYVPSGGAGRFPAVILAPGHGAAGKVEL